MVKQKKWLLILQSALCVILAVMLIVAALGIYRSGLAVKATDPLSWIYTREKAAQALTPVLPLLVIGLVLTAVGLVLGITAALNKGRFLDGFCTVFSILGVCVPSYVFLIFLQYTFSFRIPFFPYFFDPSRFAFSSVIPSISLSLFTMSTIARFTRNEMVEVFDSDYVRLAEAKGMYGRRLVTRHVLRNALIPIVTVLAPLVVDLLTGALVVEKIYGINGIGKLMVDATAGEGIDYNYVLALGILYSALYIGIMLVVDLLYGVLDPRIRVSAKGKEA